MLRAIGLLRVHTLVCRQPRAELHVPDKAEMAGKGRIDESESATAKYLFPAFESRWTLNIARSPPNRSSRGGVAAHSMPFVDLGHLRLRYTLAAGSYDPTRPLIVIMQVRSEAKSPSASLTCLLNSQ
jgi:hypothetical protein